jgi:hypothetical protein
MVYSRDTRTYINVVHLFKAAGWTLTAMQQAAVDLRDWWINQYRVSIPSAVSLTQVQMRLYDPANPLAYDLGVTPSPGLRAFTPESGNVTLTMSWRTGLAGRKFRGRIYVPGLCVTDVSSTDTVASVITAALSVAAQALYSGALSGGVVPAVFHRSTATYTPVNSHVIEALVDSQRRRLAGRGR